MYISHQPSGHPGGLEVVPSKLPLSLPSPRALDPAPLEVSRVHISPKYINYPARASKSAIGNESSIQWFS